MVQIKLERIGDADRWICAQKNKKEIIKMYLQKQIIDKKQIYLQGNSRAWCAKLIGLKYKDTVLIKKEFLTPNISYLEANGIGSRGVYAFYNLDNDNYYEINSPITWKHDEHYFCKIENNQLLKITLKEIITCLKNHLE